MIGDPLLDSLILEFLIETLYQRDGLVNNVENIGENCWSLPKSFLARGDLPEPYLIVYKLLRKFKNWESLLAINFKRQSGSN